MNKTAQMGVVMPLVVMMVAIIIGVSVALPTMIDSINGATQYTTVNNESVTLTTNTNSTLANTDLQTLAIKSADGLTTWGDSNFNEYLTQGKINLAVSPFSATHVNFTGLNNTNVTFSSDIVNTTSVALFNCTNHAESWLGIGNWSVYSNGKILLVATGLLENNTEYCLNYTYSIIPSGDTGYAYYTYEQEGYQSGVTATLINLLPVIFAIVLLASILFFAKV